MSEEKRSRKYLFWGRALNPIVLVIYGIFCFYSYSLFQFGGVKRKLPIILACLLSLIIWFIWCFWQQARKDNHGIENKENSTSLEEEKSVVNRYKFLFYIGCFAMLGMTVITGLKIYDSSINLNGKLSWFIHDLKNKRQVEFRQDNIYEFGLEGIFDDIESKVTMPKELYVSNDFRLTFDQDGRILSFDTYLYGKNEDGETESFLIYYDYSKTNKITIHLNGFVNKDYDPLHKVQPLFEMMEVIPLSETVAKWDQEEYGIVYSGVRNWGYNTDGIIYIDKEGNTRIEKEPVNEIQGYTVSVYVPGLEEAIMPARFIANWESAKIIPVQENNEKEMEAGYINLDGEEAFFLDENHGYRLQVVDAALGSRFYALLETKDSGANWERINEDPYLGDTGVSAGITFINESLGFIGLSHSGGSYSDLYRTEDGGLSFEKCIIQSIEVPLTEEETYPPFDSPLMPYEEDGKLMLLVGQGQDGDYNGGSKAMYQSIDKGVTWNYIKEVPAS